MSLRLKTILLGYAILILFGAVIYVTAHSMLLPGFVELETRDMRQDLERVAHLLDYELATMSATAADWAEWDDTYQFMADHNADFADANLYPETLANLNFNAMFLVGVDGEVVYSQGADPETGEAADILPGFDELLQPGSPLLVHESEAQNRAGIVQLSSGAAMVAASDILTSLDGGPARGTLIWVRYLNDRVAQQFGTILNLPLELYPLSVDELPQSLVDIEAALRHDRLLVRSDDADTLAGYLRLNDIYGEPALIIRQVKPRAIVAHGMQVVQTLMATLMAAGAVVLLLMVVSFRHMMLNRMSRLTALVNYVRQSGDLTVSVPARGRDELGQLATGIGSMLSALRLAHENVERSRAELEHRVAERTAELRRAKEDAEAVLANTSDAIVQADRDYRVIRVNPAFERLFGYAEAEVLGQSFGWQALMRGETELREALDQLAPDHPTERIEIQLQRKDGSAAELDVAVSAVREPDGRPRGFVGVVRDISERKQAERRQTELVAGLRRVLSLASELITSADVDTLCRRAVEALQAELGLERCSIFLEDNGDLHGTYGVNGRGKLVAEHSQRFAMNDSIWQSRQRLLNPDEARWLVVEEPHYEWDGEKAQVIGHGWVAITPIVTAGHFIGVLVNDAAISSRPFDPMLQEIVTVFCSLFGALYEQKRAEEAVKAALDRQIELNALKARFVSMVSHEFRTPLAVIQTSMDILQRYGDRISDERRQSYLQETERQVQHMKALMEDYLTLDRAEIRQLQIERTPCDMVAFCRNLIDEARLISPRRRIELHTPFEACEVEVDTGLLQQAINNLLSNAVKYSDEETAIHVTLECADSVVTLSVQDEGIGIPESEQPQLFEMFFRASNTEQRPGTGLGLAIVKRAVEAHHGTIAVSSQVGVGTTVTLSLPVAPAERAEA